MSFFRLLLITSLCLITLCGQAQIFTSNDGEISFFSKTPLEDISAVSKKAQGAINGTTKDLVFKVNITTFKFPNGLMEEHFNENYMESEKYPYGQFKGKIQEAVDLTKDGTYNVTAVGLLNIHGVEVKKTISGTITVAGGKATLKAKFQVPLAEHNIERPKVVMVKIAEIIDVSVNFVMIRK